MPDQLDRYNVVWNSPSKDASGSMPLGNGDLGINLWVEEGGDLLFLIGKTDAWDENASNLKLGRVRVKLSPNPFTAGAPFRQTLDLRRGEISIEAGETRIRVRVDANQPVIFVDAEGDADFTFAAELETWRNTSYEIKTQTGDLFRNLSGKDPHPTIVSPDHVFADDPNRIAWCHHNEKREHDGLEINMRLQGLGELVERMQHPLAGRTFGAAMEGEGLIRAGDRTLKSTARARHHRLSVYALTQHPATIETWRRKLAEVIDEIRDRDSESARIEHQRWWHEFWQRSWIFVTSSDPAESESVFHITQGYLLQRFMNAAGGRGAQPIKFNGSIFTVGKPEDPDFRRWGGPGFWFMNQRLIYWPMLACGDFDLIMPWLRMYLAQLELHKHRTQKYFGHGGAHYPETITFWGAEVSAHYGWTPFEQRKRPEAECSYVTYYWTCGLELTLILLSYHAHTQDKDFAREFLLPIADAVTEFYNLHYPRDERGQLKIEPSQALETWQDATNPTPDLAGLRYVLPKLLALPESLTTPEQRKRWSRLLKDTPPIPTGDKEDRRVILPAQRFDKLKNKENPELYAVFPFRLFGASKPDLQLAQDTFAARLHQSHECWSQDEIQMALLGLADQAKEYLTRRASDAAHSDSRFPAFWNAHHDWLPDMDHGGVLQLALQFMLLQCESPAPSTPGEGRGGGSILLLPAWPADWTADFKLHAPRQTTIEGQVQNGQLINLKVTPESRRADVVTVAKSAH